MPVHRRTVHVLVTLAAGLCAACSSHRLAHPRPELAVQTAEGRAVVVAGHPEAAELGIAVLERGGTAMDAAVTVSLALGVAEPYGSGIGGKFMALYYDATEQRVFAIEALDQGSLSLDPEAFVALPSEKRRTGWTAVATPGLLAGLEAGHERWGQLPWASLVEPVVELAESGATVLPATQLLVSRRRQRIAVTSEAERIYLDGKDVPKAGSRHRNPDLATTLRRVAELGADGFYKGPIADTLAAESKRSGGWLTAEDLASYRATISEPLRLEALNAILYSSPPPTTGGATVLLALAALEADDVSSAQGSSSALDVAVLDQEAHILQQLYPWIQATIADRPEARSAFADKLVEIQAGRRGPTGAAAGRLTPNTWSNNDPTIAEVAQPASTTHFVVVDAEGNMASVTQSLSHHFGSGVVAPGTGVLLNNSLSNFGTLDPNNPNYAAPGRRPRTTIAPTLVFRNDGSSYALGVPGGQRIPTAMLQVALDLLVFHRSLDDAIAAPRLHFRRPLANGGRDANTYELEVPLSSLRKELARLGWETSVQVDPEVFGGFCAIEVEGSRRRGVADRRRTNAARSLDKHDGL